MKVPREKLIQQLDAVAAGLSSNRETVEQSSCFVFRDGTVATFNGEIACTASSPLEITGAVAAKPLLDLLGKMAEDVVDMAIGEGELRVVGKRRRAGIRLETEIALPVDTVDDATDWQDLDAEFCDAVMAAAACASRDDNNFKLVCVHLHPDYVEACDNFQLCRFPIATPLPEPCLARRDAVKHLPGLGVTEVAVSSNWIHFRNPSGVVLSCRRFLDTYEDLDAMLDMDGTPASLPGGLPEAVEKAMVFAADSPTDSVVTVRLKSNKLLLRGEGANGWFEEQKMVKYQGPPLSFNIAPKLLVEITNRTTDCIIGDGLLKIDNGKFTYITCLEAV